MKKKCRRGDILLTDDAGHGATCVSKKEIIRTATNLLRKGRIATIANILHDMYRRKKIPFAYSTKAGREVKKVLEESGWR